MVWSVIHDMLTGACENKLGDKYPVMPCIVSACRNKGPFTRAINCPIVWRLHLTIVSDQSYVSFLVSVGQLITPINRLNAIIIINCM